MGEENKQKLYRKVTSKQNKKCNNKSCFSDGKSLNILAAVIANTLAENFEDNELAVLSLFFTILGESLSGIIAANALLSRNKEKEEEAIFLEEVIE